MADIFISYAGDDRPRVEPLAAALTDLGWDVWWDRTIPVGRTFDEVIEAALDNAKSVVVLWSEKGVASSWVRTEASEGSSRQILVPARIDDVPIPLAFRRVQAANLIDWVPGEPNRGFDQLVSAIKALVPPSAKRKEDEANAARWSAMLVEADEAVDNLEWDHAVTTLEILLAEAPNYEGADERLTRARTQQTARQDADEANAARWSAMLVEADEAADNLEWGRAITALETLIDESPNYEGADERLTRARTEQAAKREADQANAARWSAMMAEAEEAAENLEWERAVTTLETLLAESPDYEAADERLALARNKQAAAQLYEEARDQAGNDQPQAVLDIWSRITALDPHFDDALTLVPAALARLDETPLPASEGGSPAGTETLEEPSDRSASVPPRRSVHSRVRWALGGAVVLSAYLPWVPGSSDAFAITDPAPSLRFWVVVLGVAIGIQPYLLSRVWLRRALGVVLVGLVMWFWFLGYESFLFADRFLSLGFTYSMGPFVAFASGVMVVAGYPRTERDTSIETDLPRGLTLAFVVVGAVLISLGASLAWIPEFNVVTAFGIDALALVGWVDPPLSGDWVSSVGFVLTLIAGAVVVMRIVASTRTVRTRTILGGAAIVVLALFFLTVDSSIGIGFAIAALGVLVLTGGETMTSKLLRRRR